MGEGGGGGGDGAARKQRRDGEGLVVIFEPDEEEGFFGAGKALLVDPVVVGTHVRIDEGTQGIELRRGAGGSEKLHHGLLSLARGKAH